MGLAIAQSKCVLTFRMLLLYDFLANIVLPHITQQVISLAIYLFALGNIALIRSPRIWQTDLRCRFDHYTILFKIDICFRQISGRKHQNFSRAYQCDTCIHMLPPPFFEYLRNSYVFQSLHFCNCTYFRYLQVLPMLFPRLAKLIPHFLLTCLQFSILISADILFSSRLVICLSHQPSAIFRLGKIIKFLQDRMCNLSLVFVTSTISLQYLHIFFFVPSIVM